MAQDIRIPEVSDGVTAGTVISLAVAEGDQVEADQTLLEFETDKAVVEIPSPCDGTIVDLMISEGDSAEVGAVIMRIEPAGEAASVQPPPAEPSAPVEKAEATATEAPVAKTAPAQEAVAAPSTVILPQDVRIPEVSDGVTSGTIISLAVAEGDQVEADQSLLEFETDKAVVEIPSPCDGTIINLMVSEGDEAKVGAVIMKIQPTGAAAATEEVAAPQAAPPAPVAKAEPLPPAVAPHAAAEAEAATQTPVDLTATRRGEQVAPAAPSVRRLARELGVDIYQVQGTGPGGRISEKDVRAFVKQTLQRLTGGGAAPIAQGEFTGLHAQRPLPDFAKWGPIRREKLSRIREVTADSMGYAWSTVPMVTQHDRADVGALEAFRKEYNRTNRDGIKLTMTAILTKVCAVALKAFPQFNSTLDLASKELIYKDYINVGVAVDTPNGLLVPVLKEADVKGIESLATELDVVAGKARDRKLGPADLEGGTFTISNLGGIGGNAFSPIVYSPQVAILGVCRSTTEPVWNGTEFVPTLQMPLSLSYDHRVIDGADGARFLRWICQALENPIQLMMKG